MQWEELTSDQFPKALNDSGGVCIIALGVLERHGPHMPLGTDMLTGHYLACQAAKLEPSVVFPPWFFGQIYEAKCFPGTVTIPPTMLVDLLLKVFDEIGRNGFTKIVSFIAHGGNHYLAKFLGQCQLDSPKPYQLYTVDFFDMLNLKGEQAWKPLMEHLAPNMHADEVETSMLMAHRPDLLDMQALGDQVGHAQGRLSALKGIYSPFGWYGNFPQHYAGDARAATADKGRKINQMLIENMAATLRLIKNDQAAPAVAREFFDRESKLR